MPDIKVELQNLSQQEKPLIFISNGFSELEKQNILAEELRISSKEFEFLKADSDFSDQSEGLRLWSAKIIVDDNVKTAYLLGNDGKDELPPCSPEEEIDDEKITW